MADLSWIWKRLRNECAGHRAQQDQLIASAQDAMMDEAMDVEGWIDLFHCIDALKASEGEPTADRFIYLFAMIGWREVLARNCERHTESEGTADD